MATSSSTTTAELVLPATPLLQLAARSRALLAAGVAVIAAGALVLLAVAAGGDDPPAPRLRAAGFSVVVPDGWRAVDARTLRTLPGGAAAVLRREDGRGTVVVHRRPARAARPSARALTAALERRLGGVRPVRARTVALPGGPAYVYTFARPAAGSVQSIAVAPRADRTWTLDAVTGAGAPDVAAQAGAILRSFTTTDPVPRS
jgi:hypothetical protein